MSDPKANPADELVRDPELCGEIERSLSSIWQRRTGARPTAISAEFRGDLVKCAIEPGEPEADAESADADAAEPAFDTTSTDSTAYRREASAAVKKVLHRNVTAYIAAEDKKTGVETQTFILERVQIKY